jgi:predicted Zn-dependent protease
VFIPLISFGGRINEPATAMALFLKNFLLSTMTAYYLVIKVIFRNILLNFITKLIDSEFYKI